MIFRSVGKVYIFKHNLYISDLEHAWAFILENIYTICLKMSDEHYY